LLHTKERCVFSVITHSGRISPLISEVVPIQSKVPSS